MPCFGWAGTTTPGCALSTLYDHEPSVVFSLPFVPAGVPWNKHFDWTALNYSPFVNAALFLAIGIAWFAGARLTAPGTHS